jgi:hypothetical protein
LLAEFADYLEGAVAWRNPALTNKIDARLAWQKLLALPADQRQFKSVWAAFMLGKALEEEDPWRAVEYYQKTRALARDGFTDRLGLAAASLGLEARVYLNQTNRGRALELYLQQLAAGDESAATSLGLTMRELVSGGPEAFEALARNPYTRQVVSAYIISTKGLQISYGNWGNTDASVSNRLASLVSDWLQANRSANVKDAVSAESLALAAYQNHQWTVAGNWIALAGSSPVAQWLKAKLLFRAGKIDEGGAALSRLIAQFPLRPLGPGETPTELKDNLKFDGHDAARVIRGELGIYLLSRSRYAESLASFLAGGFWMDAAYVAERVMTVDELKAFVDTHSAGGGDPGDELAEKLRYLLARRLTRTIRGNEARPYYPPGEQSDFDDLAQLLQTGWNESLPAEQRAGALFAAAQLARESGMELLGTEVGPDWHICDGNCTEELSAGLRTQKAFSLMPATQDELWRFANHNADPEVRFHYRYQAAFLAWEAAKLMRNDTEETATVLCTAGSWLKARDPKTADIFYKALVRRCGGTSIGAAADHLRWFPQLEEQGMIVSDPMGDPPPPLLGENWPEDLVEEAATEFPMPGKVYFVHAGDTLATIAAAASVWGGAVTLQDILEANENLGSTRLQVGQKIIIPKP